MNKYLFLASIMLFALAGSLGYTTLTTPGAHAGKTVYTQEDCAEGETWNEETQKCEAKSN